MRIGRSAVCGRDDSVGTEPGAGQRIGNFHPKQMYPPFGNVNVNQIERTISFQCSGIAGATGPAARHAAAEPSVVATAQVEPRGDLATAEDATPTAENIKSVASFQA